MSWIHNLSIRRKLTLIILLTSSMAVLLACVVFMLYDHISFRQDMKRDLATMAAITGSNSTAALTFNDPSAAREVLQSLRAGKQIVSACIYTREGKVFAKYSSDGLAPAFVPPAVQAEGVRYEANRLLLYRRIVLNGDPIGTIYLEEDLKEMQSRLTRFMGIIAVVLLGSAVAVLVLSAKLQKVISDPILQLTQTAMVVSQDKDYSIRAMKQSGDELGLLVNQFNVMMGEIQARDAQLQAARRDLEKRVQERTRELQQEVAERRHAEIALREVNSMLAALFEAAPLAIFTLDRAENVQMWNPAAERMMGWTAQEVIGRPMEIVPPEERENYRKVQNQILRGESVDMLEVPVRRKNGSVIYVSLSVAPLYDATGQVHGTIALLGDITERKRVAEELRRAKEAAEAASQAKSEFLANMSHEIRTPMNGILGMTGLALDTELTTEQREYLTTVKSSGDSLLILLNDILDFSKIEAGKLDFDAIEFRLRDCLGATMKTLAFRAHQKGLELAYRVGLEVPDVLVGDPGRLRQIVVNLVGNAIKFTERGEVTLEVKLQKEKEDEEGVGLHFTVRDTGIGIAAEKQEMVFEAFTQADGSMSRRYGGSGLGLTISTRLVKMMKGRLWVESEPGRGSAFHFTARMSWPQRKIAPLKQVPPFALCNLPVLIVDDNQTNRTILQEILRNWGMTPAAVESGKAALAALQQARQAESPFALVLVDAQMPEMDGFDLIQRIHEDSTLSGASIMMLSSCGQAGDAARCRQLGVSAYLVKPVQESELLVAIRTVLVAPEARTREQDLLTRHSLREAPGIGRILLAEDNAVNRELALRLLEKHGYRVITATNGREALAVLEKEAVDLVLMDVQMPEMDGFEATRAVREGERKSGAHLPIVAITAHAMKGYREQCLTAGMDGYIVKPIQIKELFETIARYLPAQFAEEPSASEPQLPAEEAFNLAAALQRLEGDRELLAELVRLFEQESVQLLAEMHEALAQHNSHALQRAAHTLKGSVGNFCAAQAYAAAEELERLAREGYLGGAEMALAALEKEISRLRPVLDEFIHSVER
jgi:two-component system sensor histidine kinase/response regulator